MSQLIYDATAAAGYERGFSRVTSHFIPVLLRAGAVVPGQRVLDVATGTGLAAEAALGIVGNAGHVTATDISEQMVERARERLSGISNVTVRVDDGQALGLPGDGFDVVLCSLGLMFFPAPERALAEFYRVLRSGGEQRSLSTRCPNDLTIPASIRSLRATSLRRRLRLLGYFLLAKRV